MVSLDEDEIGTGSPPSGYGSLDLKGKDLYKLVDLKVLKTLLEVAPIWVA